MTKNSKRILSITVSRMLDDFSDTSLLGEYGDRAKSEYAIDRAHSEDCASLFPLTSEAIQTLYHAQDHINSLRVDSELDTPDDMELSSAIAIIGDLIAEYEEPSCDCSRAGRFDSRSYRYFNPCWENYKGEPEEDIRKYCKQDYDRMESLSNGDWCYLGIKAKARVQLTGDTVQTIQSGGLWGIESDSGDSYFAEVEREELSQLRVELRALGFSTRAISAAFKDVQHKD